MLHTQALRYSADRDITIGQLRETDEKSCPPLDKVRKYCQTHRVDTMVSDQPGYHYKRQSVRPMPHILYLMGDVSLLDRPILGIVGPRLPSEYGKKVVGHILDQLPGYDLVTVSGLADGIDILCHQGSLDRQIPTIAVLGGGIHYFLTSEKKYLIDRIVAGGGLIISESKLDAKPTHYSFPQRNRLIAGLSHALIIPEAGVKSGSLITADYAISTHKPIYGVMNSIFHSQSAGLLSYIQNGSIKPLYDIQSMLAQHFVHTTIQENNKQIMIDLDDTQQIVYQYIVQTHDCQIQQILDHCKLDIGVIQTALSYLEMYDLVVQSQPGVYTIP